MSFSANTKILNEGRVHRVRLLGNGEPLCYWDVLNLWQSDESFFSYFSQLLADAPFQAYFWETPPLTRATADQPFEYVLVEALQLMGVESDKEAFAEYFDHKKNEDVLSFANLGHDALLIAPSPREKVDRYTHLAVFSREASARQQQAFWQRVGREVMGRLSDSPLWVSTSGLGIYWLHVRLDIRPKYYTWRPYTVI